jgi:hypothetical protein
MWPSVLLSRALVSLQMQVDGDARVTSSLYIAAARVLARVYRMEARMVQADASNGDERC